MKATEDIENEFLTVVTQTLWDRHNHLIDETIATRKNALLEILELLRDNPISGG